MEDRVYHYINNDYKIDFAVPDALQYLIDDAEEADASGDLGNYYAYADMIDVAAKNCYASGAITSAMWDTLCMRYFSK